MNYLYELYVILYCNPLNNTKSSHGVELLEPSSETLHSEMPVSIVNITGTEMRSQASQVSSLTSQTQVSEVKIQAWRLQSKDLHNKFKYNYNLQLTTMIKTCQSTERI